MARKAKRRISPMRDVAGVQLELRRLYRESRIDPDSVDTTLFGRQTHLLKTLVESYNKQAEIDIGQRLADLEESIHGR